MKTKNKNQQQGLTLVGLIFLLVIVAMIGLLALKVVPAVSEYLTVKRLIVSSKDAGTTPREIQAAFDRGADVGYVTSIAGRDLDITRDGNGFEISFAYEKKIPLVGPASLLLEFEGTTARKSSNKAIE